MGARCLCVAGSGEHHPRSVDLAGWAAAGPTSLGAHHPRASGMSVGPSVPLREFHVAGWGGSPGKLLQGNFPSSTKCLFFHFFFLKNSSCSSLLLHARVCALPQSTSPTRPGTVWVRAHHGLTLRSPQPHPQSLWVLTAPVCLPHLLLIPLL